MVAAFLAQNCSGLHAALRRVFRTTPLSLSDWSWAALVALSVVVVVEIDKGIRRRKTICGRARKLVLDMKNA